MRVIIVMVMLTTLMNQLRVLLKPSRPIGLGPRVLPVTNGHLNLIYPN